MARWLDIDEWKPSSKSIQSSGQRVITEAKPCALSPPPKRNVHIKPSVSMASPVFTQLPLAGREHCEEDWVDSAAQSNWLSDETLCLLSTRINCRSIQPTQKEMPSEGAAE
ncbi:unnamed protein product, partial [Arctogadus glacialis]